MTNNVAAPRQATRRLRRALAIAAVAGLASVGLVASPSQAQSATCTGSMSNVIVPGSLEVPQGYICNLTNVLVTGPITVQANADLFMEKTTVTGSLTVNTNGFAYVTDSTVTSGTRLRNAFGVVAESSTLTFGVDVRDSTFFISNKTNHAGEIVSFGGWTFVESGQIAGGIRTVGDEATDMIDSTVGGNVKVHMADGGSVVCQTTIVGLLGITNSSGTVQLGGDQPQPACGSNVVIGGVQLYDNTANIQVSSNLVIGSLDCTGNNPGPHGSGNLVIGPSIGQCGSLTPASGVQSIMTTPDERKDAIWQLIDQRMA